ncbi:MAG: class I SAM-dependent methyltransferase [Acidimicrobiales bacterium]
MNDADAWDLRYEQSALVWSAEPNCWVSDYCSALPPGRSLDLAAGEGRNSIWLATRGWTATAVDFSGVGLDKGRRLAEMQGEEIASRIDWVTADVTTYQPEPQSFDLVMLVYLQVTAASRRAAIANAARAVAPGGSLLVVAHDRTNLEEGTGGPQDPDVLYSSEDVAADLDETGLEVERAERVLRNVEGERDAIDALIVARRPAGATVS